MAIISPIQEASATISTGRTKRDTLRCKRSSEPVSSTDMSLVLRLFFSSVPLMALPAVAAVGDSSTGITSVGPAIFIFVVAGALLLTLLLRSSGGYVTRFLGRHIAERRIRRALSARSKDVLHDIILPGAYGGLAKIDHAVMTAGGILCIRALTMSGIVFGAEDDAQWINIDGIKRRRFLNPIIQNEGRARAIRNVVPNAPVTNLVIFSGGAEFSSPPPKNVIRIENLESFVAKHVSGPSKVDDWDAAWLELKSAVQSGDDVRKDFAAQIGFS